MQPSDQCKNRLSGGVIKITGRFIRQQKLWARNESAGNCDTLLLTPRKFAGPMMRTFIQTNFAQPLPGLRFRLALTGAPHQEGHRHVLYRRELRQQVVKLPDISNRSVAKIRGCLVGKRSQLKLGAVYVTLRSTIKRAEDVQ